MTIACFWCGGWETVLNVRSRERHRAGHPAGNDGDEDHVIHPGGTPFSHVGNNVPIAAAIQTVVGMGRFRVR